MNGRIESFCAIRDSGLLTRLTQDYQQDLQLAFKMFDVDGDGYVCAEDLKHIMKSLGNDLSDEEIRTIYSHLDTDDNGLIDFAEFESIKILLSRKSIKKL